MQPNSASTGRGFHPEANGWLFHCADALPTNAQFDLIPQWLNSLVLGPHVARLQAWASTHPDVRLLAGYMWTSFFEAQKGAA